MDDRSINLHLTQRRDFQFDVVFDDETWTPILVDEPAPLGEGRGPDAKHLLGAAIGNCLAASLLYCMQKSRIEVHGMKASIEGTLERNAAGRLRVGAVRVTLQPSVAGTPVAKLARCAEIFEDFCVVTQSVRVGIGVEVHVDPSFGPVEELDEEHELAVRHSPALAREPSTA